MHVVLHVYAPGEKTEKAFYNLENMVNRKFGCMRTVTTWAVFCMSLRKGSTQERSRRGNYFGRVQFRDCGW